MPRKRKASPVPSEQPPDNKRRTRSSGPLVQTQPEAARKPVPKRQTRHATTTEKAPTVTRINALDRDESTSSLKENKLYPVETIFERAPPAKALKTYQTRNRPSRHAQVIVQIEVPRQRPLKKAQSKPISQEISDTVVDQTSSESEPDAAPVTPAKRGAPSTQASPSKGVELRTPAPSPTKRTTTIPPEAFPTRTSRLSPTQLPAHLLPCFHAQRRAILHALQNPPEIEVAHDLDEEDDLPTNTIGLRQLSDLLDGTVARGEGNSCLLLGPRGSGKSRILQQCLSSLPVQPIVIRLSGWAQSNARLAMREIARQLAQQTGESFLADEDDNDSDPDEEPNPFLEQIVTVSLPPPSHLTSLISMLPTLSRPTIVLLDGFDLFALHPRQSLLYCLLDTAQSCRAGSGDKGLAVIGMTTRVDTINLLEKRVKSRFSGRTIRTAPPRMVDDWIALAKEALCVPIKDVEGLQQWKGMWTAAIEQFLEDPLTVETLTATFSLTRDVRMLSRLLTAVVLELKVSSPFPRTHNLETGVNAQRSRPKTAFLHVLPYPSMCLLIAAVQWQTAGHEVVTFEMLYDRFHTQVRASTAAPVQVDGASIGMVKCTREVLLTAFEQLIQRRVFMSVAPPSTTVAKEFVVYRCTVDRAEVKSAVDAMGQTNLKKWLAKGQ